MSFSSVLELALGIALIYYVLSLVVSYITSEIAERTQLRAKNLLSELKELLGEVEGPANVESFMKHPWIQSLAPKKIDLIWRKHQRMVPDISSLRFAQTMLKLWFPDKNGDDPVSLEELRQIIDTLPEGPHKKELLEAVNNSIRQVKDVGLLLERIYDDEIAPKIASLYKQYARSIVVAVSLIVTLVIGVDSIKFAITLWESNTARAQLAAIANGVAETEPEAAPPPSLEELEEKINFPIGWTPEELNQLRQLEPNFLLWKIVGLLITWLAIAQGSSFWYQVLRGIRQSTEKPKEEKPIVPLGEIIPTSVSGSSATQRQAQEAQPPSPKPASSPPQSGPEVIISDLERLAQLADEVAQANLGTKIALILLKRKVEQEELAVTDEQIEEALAVTNRD